MGACKHQPALTNNRATMLNNRLTNNRATQLEQSMNRQIFLVTLVLKLVKTEIQLE